MALCSATDSAQLREPLFFIPLSLKDYIYFPLLLERKKGKRTVSYVVSEKFLTDQQLTLLQNSLHRPLHQSECPPIKRVYGELHT